MKREITKEFIAWQNRKNHKPLIVRGARQVGKTYVIEDFAGTHFQNYLKINFEEQIELKSIFKTCNVKRIQDELSILFSIDIFPGQTLLFFDEIQACPEAIVSLRYFYEQYPDLHIIAAGSLLDFTLKELNYSMPVGRVEFCYMFPMSFKEFLQALSQDRLIKYIKDFTFDENFSKSIHHNILEYLRLYLFIGGMPEVVKAYVSQEKLTDIERIQSNILTTLQYDFAKYGTKKQQEYLLSVFRYSAHNIGKKVKYVNIDRDIRSANIKKAFKRLELSRLLQLITHTNTNCIPLLNGANKDIYKPLFLDIGLANHLCGIRLIEIEKIFTSYEGALAEQFVGQELLTTGAAYLDPKLFYWTREERNSNAEIDYVYQYNNNIFPIEVKSGKSGSLKSLHVYLFEKKLHYGIRFNSDIPSIGKFTIKVRTANQAEELEYRLISLPLYMCFQLPGIIQNLLE